MVASRGQFIEGCDRTLTLLRGDACCSFITSKIESPAQRHMCSELVLLLAVWQLHAELQVTTHLLMS